MYGIERLSCEHGEIVRVGDMKLYIWLEVWVFL
jgi:hypothetical protein